MAPQLAQADYSDIATLGGVGATRESLLAAQAAEQAARFGYQQAEPTQRIGQYLAAVGGGGLGSQQTSLQPQQAANPLLGLLGGAAVGGSISPTLPFVGGGAALGALSTLV